MTLIVNVSGMEGCGVTCYGKPLALVTGMRQGTHTADVSAPDHSHALTTFLEWMLTQEAKRNDGRRFKVYRLPPQLSDQGLTMLPH